MKRSRVTSKDVNLQWYHVDADGQVIGRLAAGIAMILMGKHKPTYTPHMDTGDFVVVTNAGKVRLSGTKSETKGYDHHSGYPGGLTTESFKRKMVRRPEFPLYNAVRLMLPKSKLSAKRLTKLKLYAGDKHPHEAQNPVPLKFTGRNSIYTAGSAK